MQTLKTSRKCHMPPITAEQDRWWTRSETACWAVACDLTSAGVALLCIYTTFACLFHLSASYYSLLHVRKGHVLKRFKCNNQKLHIWLFILCSSWRKTSQFRRPPSSSQAPTHSSRFWGCCTVKWEGVRRLPSVRTLKVVYLRQIPSSSAYWQEPSYTTSMTHIVL